MLRRIARIWAVILMLLVLANARGQGLGFGGFGLSGGGGAAAAPGAARPSVTARAAVNAEPLVPGQDAQIAVEVTINPRYHVQSAFAARPFIAMKLTVQPVPGLQFGPIRFPKPTDIPTPPALGAGILSVYEGTVYALVPVSVAADAAPGERTVELSLLTQACDDKTCEPPKNILLTVGVKLALVGTPQTPTSPELFAAAAKQQYATETFPATPSTQPNANAAAAPSTSSQVAGSAANGGGAEEEAGGKGRSAGRPVKLLSTDQQLALIAARNYQPHNTAEQDYPLWLILLLALVGGAILNVMPCVLPVIPLKVLSLVQQAHGDRRLAVMHGLTFSAGVIALFVALAIVLKTFGLFYGQQFQSPAFLIVMTMFVVALALSMLGVWTINPPRAVYSADERFRPHSGYLGSFGSGIMATLLATPCSAPYLGPVLAWALVQPTWLAALALAEVGLGMSAPYLVFAAFPGLLNRLPRAGRWSELLKQGLGIVMIGVAIYLVTLVPNVQMWPWVLAGTVVVGLVCWGWGQIPMPTMDTARVWFIRAEVVAAGLLLGGAVYWAGARATRASAAMILQGGESAFLPDQTTGEWLPFNMALVDEALKDGRPVVIDWTADWCINCRVLEVTVLSKEAVRKSFADRRAVLLRADLSQDNPPATALNRKLGGEAIPVLAIFSPARPTEPVVLRDSYGQSRVIDEVSRAR